MNDLLFEHLKGSKFIMIDQLKKMDFNNVYFVVLSHVSSNPTMLDISTPTRTGVLPVFFNKDGIFSYDKLHKHQINRFMSTFNGYLQKNLVKKIIKLDDTQVYSVLDPLHGRNFGHQLITNLCVLSDAHKNDLYGKTLISYPTCKHLIQLKEWYSDLKNYQLLFCDKLNQLYHIPRIYFYRISKMDLKPTPIIKNITDFFIVSSTGTGNTYEKIALIKTDKNKLLPTEQYGTFSNSILKNVQDLGFHVVDHEKTDIRYLVFLLKHAKQIIVTWGAVAYFTIFLRNHQRCLVLLHEKYKYQLARKGTKICFHPKLFNNYLITKPLPRDPSIEVLNKWVDKL